MRLQSDVRLVFFLLLCGCWLRLALEDFQYLSVASSELFLALIFALAVELTDPAFQLSEFGVGLFQSVMVMTVLLLVRQIGRRVNQQEVLGLADPLACGILCLSLTLYGVAILWVLVLPIGWAVQKSTASRVIPLIYVLVVAWALVHIWAFNMPLVLSLGD